MSSRVRALGFGAAALGCAALAAAVAGSYSSGVDAQLGELRPVLVVRTPLVPGRSLKAGDIRRTVEVRRVPESFAPPDALADPAEAVGGRLAAALVPGSYVTRSDFRVERREGGGADPTIARDRSPVEIAVAGAGAISAAASRGREVDVVVTTEPGPGGAAGRTYVAAERVPLLGLRRGGGSGLPGESAWVATLALRRAEALRLIRAESFARSVRLLGG